MRSLLNIKILLILFLLGSSQAVAQLEEYTKWIPKGIENDTLHFFTPNGLDNPTVAAIVSGLKFSMAMGSESITQNILNESTAMPIWRGGSSMDISAYQGVVVINPFIVDLGYYDLSFDISELDRNFALPPTKPGTERGTTVDAENFYGGVSYIPALLFWGYVIPSVGAVFHLNNYSFNGKSTMFMSVGLSADVYLKYNILFVGASYKKFLINQDTFDDQFRLQAGIWFQLF